MPEDFMLVSGSRASRAKSGARDSVESKVSERLPFSVKGVEILAFDDFWEGVSIWEAAGRPKGRSPEDYVNSPDFKRLRFTLEQTGHRREQIHRVSGSKHWFFWAVGYDYASWISDRFKLLVSQAARSWFQEEVNPDLKVERAWDRTVEDEGGNEDRAFARFTSIPIRKMGMTALASCRPPHMTKDQFKPLYGELTAYTTRQITGHNPSELAVIRTGKKGNSRNVMTATELGFHIIAESRQRELTMEDVRRNGPQGPDQGRRCFKPVADQVGRMAKDFLRPAGQ